MNNNNNQPKFLGRGWAFPPCFSKVNNEVQMVNGTEDIVQSLHILLSTQLGERVMQSEYGCNLEHLLFEPLSQSTQSYITKIIEHSIILYEPRIKLIEIDYDMQDVYSGLVMIDITFEIVKTNSRFNFVFPFYLNEGTETSALQRHTSSI